MDRRKKYTHLIAPCNSAARAVTAARLQKVCGSTISDAYWRLTSGKGLLTKFDAETYNLWSDIITRVRRYTNSPLPLGVDYRQPEIDFKEELDTYRSGLLERMEEYREWLFHGGEVYRLPDYTPELPYIFVEVAMAELMGGGKDPILMDRDEQLAAAAAIKFDDIISLAQEFAKNAPWVMKAWANFQKLRQTKGVDPDIIKGAYLFYHGEQNGWLASTKHQSFRKHDKVYQIRTNFENRKSDSEIIRSTLYLIWDVQQLTDDETRAVIDNDIAILDEMATWKRETKEHKPEKWSPSDMYESVMSFLERIKVPIINSH